MLEMLGGGPRHPLRTLRESAGISQTQLAKVTRLSTTKISMSGNYLGQPLTAAEEKKSQRRLWSSRKQRQKVVLSEARR
jgi:hypothetical protein